MIVLEMICQQRYRVAGNPVDLSPYRNHGIATGTSTAPGPGISGEAITFDAINSAVHISSGSAAGWQPLTALKIEVDVRVPDPTVARTLCLIEGDAAFRFQIFEHAIEAAFFTGNGVEPTYLRAGDAYAPDHSFHPVAPGRWVTLGLYHDGFAKAQLTMDGRLVAETLVKGSVAGVGPGGVSIGNGLGGDTPLHGAISELRVWRLDPQALRREFLCRPIDADVAACLLATFEQTEAWIAAHPREAAQIVALIQARTAETVRTLQLLPDKERSAAHAALDHMLGLWCQGRIDGAEMEDAIAAWREVLAHAGIPDTQAIDAARILDISAAAPFPEISVECDEALCGFLKLLGRPADPHPREVC
jgi:hypothetical protein